VEKHSPTYTISTIWVYFFGNKQIFFQLTEKNESIQS